MADAPGMTPQVRHHPAFEPVRSHAIANLQVTLHEFRHIATGAKHFHLSTEHRENAFLVAFRTLPGNSRGAAHILEHTVLCGSERYPVRDPFFFMLRRSLNTFMNAFTSSDFTAYPFASQNHKDFLNLLDVYLDAVFFCTLDPLDFAQEGHRLEFADEKDPGSALVYKGVVYNEMKGDSSSIVSLLYDTLKKYLYPATTYHYNSGGDPEYIPDLTIDELREFHRVHYHPSNAVFMTFGDLPVESLQERMEADALGRFTRAERLPRVNDERRYFAPVRVEEYYPLPETEQGIEDRTHVVMGWLLGQNTDIGQLLRAHLLSELLLDTSASPLRRVLETTDLGKAVSPLCGLEDSNREMCFLCGIEGSEPGRAEAVEKLVLDELERVATEGIPYEDLEAVLHQLELHQREIGGDGMPYGLQLMMGAVAAAIHGGDVAAMLDLEEVLVRLREEIRDPEFPRRLVRELLLENPHRVTLTFKPDDQLARRRDQALARGLERLRARLSSPEREEIVELAARLRAHQDAPQPEELLPRVGLEDIDSGLQVPRGDRRELAAGVPVTTYGQGTNGIVYLQLITEIPRLEDQLLVLLPWYTALLTEVGSGGRDYLETQRVQQRVTGGVNAFSGFRCSIDHLADARGFLTLSSKALARNFTPMLRVLEETRSHVTFDEPRRIAELIAQARARRDAGITNGGTQLAMTAAGSCFSPVIGLNHRLTGLEGIRFLRRLDEEMQAGEGVERLADGLRTLHERFRSAPCEFLLIAEPGAVDALASDLDHAWHDPGTGSAAFTPVSLVAGGLPVKQLWTTNTQVSFCARAYPTVPEGHEDCAALIVLGGVLRNGYLHGAVREKGGAYGAGASQDASNGVFRFSSFRDPHIGETLEHFERAIDWFRESDVPFAKVEEAILAVVSSIDAPGSPAGEARQAFHNGLFGRTAEHRERLRRAVLDVRTADLRRVVDRYLAPERASTVVLTSGERARAAALPDYEIMTL